MCGPGGPAAWRRVGGARRVYWYACLLAPRRTRKPWGLSLSPSRSLPSSRPGCPPPHSPWVPCRAPKPGKGSRARHWLPSRVCALRAAGPGRGGGGPCCSRRPGCSSEPRAGPGPALNLGPGRLSPVRVRGRPDVLAAVQRGDGRGGEARPSATGPKLQALLRQRGPGAPRPGSGSKRVGILSHSGKRRDRAGGKSAVPKAEAPTFFSAAGTDAFLCERPRHRHRRFPPLPVSGSGTAATAGGESDCCGWIGRVQGDERLPSHSPPTRPHPDPRSHPPVRPLPPINHQLTHAPIN